MAGEPGHIGTHTRAALEQLGTRGLQKQCSQQEAGTCRSDGRH